MYRCFVSEWWAFDEMSTGKENASSRHFCYCISNMLPPIKSKSSLLSH